MSLIDTLIRREEDRKTHAYPDPLTHGAPWTIGEGHTGPEVHEGLVWMDAQIDAAKAATSREPRTTAIRTSRGSPSSTLCATP
jgi:GH24 family phage-related lysozyme (muramidase)